MKRVASASVLALALGSFGLRSVLTEGESKERRESFVSFASQNNNNESEQSGSQTKQFEHPSRATTSSMEFSEWISRASQLNLGSMSLRFRTSEDEVEDEQQQQQIINNRRKKVHNCENPALLPSVQITVPHAEEGLEKLGFTFFGQMVAGASAGVMEHVFMFPVDTIKTRLQARHLLQTSHNSVVGTAKMIVSARGIAGFYNGMSAVLVGAIPSHALYFLAYEGARRQFNRHAEWGYSPLCDAVSGALATAAHDAASCPIDVVKQRAQLEDHGKIKTLSQRFRDVYAERGLRTFFAAYPTTLLMNVPFFSVYSMVYEQLRALLTSSDDPFSPVANVVAGAGAGALGAAISNPLDVIKTRLQTQVGATVAKGFKEIARDIHSQHGIGGFFHGVAARMLYHMPAAAICWVTYEYVNHLFGITRVRSLFIADPHLLHPHDDEKKK